MNPFEDLLGLVPTTPASSETPQYLWATIVSVSPVLIRMDGDDAPLAISPTPLMNPQALGVGKRVLVLYKGRSLYIMGSDKLNATGIPTGSLAMYAGNLQPEGYLFAHGQLVSQAAYPELFLVLGDTYGSGSGTFGIPDMRGRVPVGLNLGDSDFGALGAFPGAKTHTLTAAQMPSHTHGGTTNSDGAHTHGQRFSTGNVAAGGGSAVGGMTSSGGNSSGTAQQSTVSAGAHTHSFTTGSAGSGNAHNNIQPSRVLNFIIKT